jgi:hypothetical protein
VGHKMTVAGQNGPAGTGARQPGIPTATTVADRRSGHRPVGRRTASRLAVRYPDGLLSFRQEEPSHVCVGGDWQWEWACWGAC